MGASIDVIYRYLHLLERFETSEAAFAGILHREFRQKEMPNALNPLGQESDWNETFRRMSAGKTILTAQRFVITSSLADGERAAVEATWTGTMAIDAGPLKKNQTMTAYFCMIFDFKEGLIHRQRNYDCFEPLA